MPHMARQSTPRKGLPGSSRVCGKSVVRVGGVGNELLVQQAFFRTLTGSGHEKTVVPVCEPLVLSEGKGAWQ
eukprot:9649322-Lingulodinium_polyedra.AAC.1